MGARRWFGKAIPEPVAKLQKVMKASMFDQEQLEDWVEEIFATSAWTGCCDADGNPFKSFPELALAPLPHGLQIDRQPKAERLRDTLYGIGKPAEWEALLTQIVTRPGHPPPENVRFYSVSTASGAPDRMVLRLRKQAPKYLEGFYAGEYETLRQAAKAAGLLPSVRNPWNELRAVVKAFRGLTEEEQVSFILELESELHEETCKRLVEQRKKDSPGR